MLSLPHHPRQLTRGAIHPIIFVPDDFSLLTRWLAVNEQNKNAHRPFQTAGERLDDVLGDASKRIEQETQLLIKYINDELVPAIREHSSNALRIASEKGFDPGRRYDGLEQTQQAIAIGTMAANAESPLGLKPDLFRRFFTARLKACPLSSRRPANCTAALHGHPALLLLSACGEHKTARSHPLPPPPSVTPGFFLRQAEAATRGTNAQALPQRQAHLCGDRVGQLVWAAV